MTYHVLITLTTGNKVVARVEAENQAQAIERLTDCKQFIDFCDNCDIATLDIIPIPDTPQHDYLLQQGSLPNTWVATDLNTLMVVRWEDGKFNETSKFTPINELPPLDMATVTRLLVDWLTQNHKEKL